MTSKHKRINMNNLMDNTPNNFCKTTEYICVCGNKYIYASGLSKHKKKCKKVPNNNCVSNNENVDTNNINFLELLKQNQEFKELISEQNKIILKFAENSCIK